MSLLRVSWGGGGFFVFPLHMTGLEGHSSRERLSVCDQHFIPSSAYGLTAHDARAWGFEEMVGRREERRKKTVSMSDV